MSFCPECGEENPEGSKFCRKCGINLVYEEPEKEEPKTTAKKVTVETDYSQPRTTTKTTYHEKRDNGNLWLCCICLFFIFLIFGIFSI